MRAIGCGTPKSAILDNQCVSWCLQVAANGPINGFVLERNA